MNDWDKRYEEALEEWTSARLQWSEAESALARANARRDRAERTFHRIFQEKMDQLERRDAVSRSEESND